MRTDLRTDRTKAGRPVRRPLRLAAAIGLAAVLGGMEGARAEPPIRSAEDAFCRSEARAQVFSAPDPMNLGLHEIGRRIWASCMERRKGGKGKTHKRRRHRR